MNELADSVFTDAPGFLEAVFPVSGDLLNVMMNDASERTGLYNETKKRWVDYPADPENYETFIQATRIRKAWGLNDLTLAPEERKVCSILCLAYSTSSCLDRCSS